MILSFFLLAAQRVIEFLEIPFKKTKFHNLHTASAQWRRATLKIYNNAETTDEQHT